MKFRHKREEIEKKYKNNQRRGRKGRGQKRNRSSSPSV
jgi:hypothetical protein